MFYFNCSLGSIFFSYTYYYRANYENHIFIILYFDERNPSDLT